ncbi:Y-family DNA polymerase [Pseudomonas typographi]|uniref:DNA polymerase Y family protein n=1 Tax=Pseudomonas typographi TaxID=2715964 RepID=A0ABR7Z0P2_9PSED|nr:DNA polymerase Y family protein [Pseudomonas typographi]MBD1551305.1 DNA polymerase Y family protein [Pseudomonas typographi]MBD1588813.1 DNA polymerase Y family protein [Pseudomonas typographi]MBD1598929.1 DNA polymerase Y family protein [Pseudomonas typographi]
MLWACILLPQLALDGVLRGRADPARPLVLLGGPTQRRVLKAANASARALGLRPGLPLSTAQALALGFDSAEYDLAQVAQAERLLAAWAYGFSAQVSLHYPRALLLEVGSSLGLFGPWPHFQATLHQGLAAMGFSRRITLAPNPVAARVLANLHDGLAVTDPAALEAVLCELPIACAGLAREHAASCQRMGLRRLGQLLGLPRQAVARRFPAELLQHLDRLRGLAPMALEFYQPPDRFEARIELNYDVESTQALLFPLRRLVADLAAYVLARDGGVQRFVVQLEHALGPPTEVPVGLLGAERDPGRLFELARGRLEPVQVARPVRSLRLLAEQLPAFVPGRRELFDARPQQLQPWEQLRERLRARLGDDAVLGLGYAADHRPEQAWRAAPGPPAQAGGTRPGWLLPQVQPFAVDAGALQAGPERVESGWWDGGDVRRDYYRVQLPDGRLAWVYRALGEPEGLWLQGWFG